MTRTLTMLTLSLAVGLAACSIQQEEIRQDRLTVGKVQGEITLGLDAAKVAELLGSPNIVTTDDKHGEVWMYDKVSTDRVDMASFSYGTLAILGGTSRDSSSSTRQRTLTIIKFDEVKKPREFAYNYTQF